MATVYSKLGLIQNSLFVKQQQQAQKEKRTHLDLKISMNALTLIRLKEQRRKFNLQSKENEQTKKRVQRHPHRLVAIQTQFHQKMKRVAFY